MLLRVVAAMLCVGCSSPAPPPPVPTPLPAPSPSPSPSAPVASAKPRPLVHEDNVLLQLEAYRLEFEPRFRPQRAEPPKTLLDAPGASPIGHQIVSYDPLLVTVGFARRAQRDAVGETPKHVELSATPPRPSLSVAKTLAALGSWMHAVDRPIDVRFKAFEPLRVRVPLFDLEHFLLVPGGDVSLATPAQVSVLTVIPVAPDEYAHIKMRGDGAARAWWHTHRGDPGLPARWAPTLRHDR